MCGIVGAFDLTDRWFDPAALRRFAREHQSGLSDHSAGLWALLMFDGFLRTLAER